MQGGKRKENNRAPTHAQEDGLMVLDINYALLPKAGHQGYE